MAVDAEGKASGSSSSVNVFFLATRLGEDRTASSSPLAMSSFPGVEDADREDVGVADRDELLDGVSDARIDEPAMIDAWAARACIGAMAEGSGHANGLMDIDIHRRDSSDGWGISCSLINFGV